MMTIGTAFGVIAVFAIVLGNMSLLFSIGP